MKYLLALYDDEKQWMSLSEEEMGEVFAAYGAYSEALEEAGAFVSGEPLEPTHIGQRFRTKDGRLVVQDGPFSDTKEQLGGYYLIEAPDLDAALDWAAKCPCASYGVVEVRPVWEM
ncbi:YciI family protein [Aquisalinus flavus]|uniref:YCII-related domain-containing protein n=1 Tax=Aquisalinus flavus TaxID=1526572 RepID=A0A8J2V454_9PROT|nr:YciI family protein [Aquisalinus flavus]MBD0427643.1 YciI family protein [Aquisalinus flavus]UNE47430.1 YciI family protein [Aquisalinus flavus]GGD02653.1 hypothetical protein GCM10011342_09570 [Aquisalinus flavus]